jgi:OOP family OmpA-OmpF porin
MLCMQRLLRTMRSQKKVLGMCASAQMATVSCADNASLPVSFSCRHLRSWESGMEAAGAITVLTRRNSMSKSFKRKQMGLAAACALALGMLSGVAGAQDVSPQTAKDRTFVTTNGTQVVRSGFGLCWHSGFGPAPAPGPECDPNYVAYVAPPPVVAKPAPVPPAKLAVLAPPASPRPVGEKVTLDADALFDFDKSTLRPAGRDTLDNFIGKLRDISPETIMTIGHADRFGTDAYNQRLSEQRVATVKAYMVGKGVEPGRIYTEGKGEKQSVTKAGDCTGPKSAKVIACLQPDRRVDIEVIGTKIVR